jgi:hypothetical protein
MDTAKLRVMNRIVMSVVVAITIVVSLSWVLGIAFWLTVPGGALGIVILLVAAAVPFAKDAQITDPALGQALVEAVTTRQKFPIDWRPLLRRAMFWLILAGIIAVAFKFFEGVDGRP